MSVRANSLRIMVVDTLFYTGIMSLAAASWTAVANGAEPRIAHVADAASENRPSSDHVDSRLNTDDTPASGIPEESPAAKRESMMLGMKLFERSEGNIEVVDVAAASPAWDAGIRAGDRLREIDGVKPRRLAAWVEDVGKVLANTEDGKSVAAEVERDGYPMEVRIKMPVSNVATARDARKQDEELARMQSREQRQLKNGQQPGAPIGVGVVDRNDYGPGPAYGGGYGGYGGWGMGGFFDDGGGVAGGDANGGDRMATSAAAPLMAVNTAGRGGTQGAGGQVGMAGFQNSGDGVEAMVVVRGLPQGTYQVGIGSGGEFGMDGTSNLVGPDANAAGFGLQPALEGTADSYNRGGVGPNQQQPGVNQPGAAPGMRGPNGNQVPNQQQPGQPGFAPQGGQAPVVPQGGVPGGAAPGGVAPGAGGGAGGGGAAPAGGDGASLANPRNAILAQQLDTQQPAGGAQNATRPAQPSAFPATGQNPAAAQRNNNSRAAASGANPYDPRDRAEAQRQAQQGNNPLGGTGGSPMVASLGTLQIGPDGSGQVQNRLPGMSVRDLAGMQVIVQSTNWGGGAGGAAVDPRVAGNPGAQNQAGQNQFGQNPAAQGQTRTPQGNTGQQTGQQPLDANGQPTRGAQGIVAAGTIQLRGGGGTGANQQPGANPNAVDEATRREQGRSQISDPTQEFNPSNPLE